jgi:hypothetical protein
VVAIAIGSGIGSSPVRAQQAQSGTNAGWIFTPSLSVGGSWDDNVLLGGALNPGDYGTPVSPSVSLDFGGRRTVFSTGYDGTFQMYRNFDELNSFRQYFRAFVQRRMTRRLSISAQEVFAAAPTTDVLDLLGIPFYRIGSRTNVAGVAFDAALSKLTTLRGGYSRRTVWFDERPIGLPGDELQGGYSNELETGLQRTMSPRLSLGGNYRLQRSVLSDGLDRFNIHTAAATMQYRLAPNLSLSAAAGVARLEAGVDQDARTGPSVQAAITHQGARATASLSYQQTFIPSYGFGGTFRNQAVAGTLRVPFARGRAYTLGSVLLQNNEPLVSDQANVRSLGLSASVGYLMTRWLTLEGFFSRSQQNDRRINGDVVRNQAGFRVVATKPIKLR